jgi:acetyl-CoA carboxylase carboxyltransferase component
VSRDRAPQCKPSPATSTPAPKPTGPTWEGFLEQIAYLNEQLALARAGGGEKYVERHRQRGKLMARERIELLLDRDSPFLEIAPLCAWGTEFGIGGSAVSGIGVFPAGVVAP